MDHYAWATAANICQALVMPICFSAYLPQWKTILKQRSSADISLTTYLVWTFAAILEVFYAVTQVTLHGVGQMLLVSSFLTLVFLLTTAILIYRFRPRASASNHLSLTTCSQPAIESDRECYISSEHAH